jgi:PqqD family protein of HPr-rel-A system
LSASFVGTSEVDSAPLDDGGVVLFHPSSGKFVLLNRSSAVVWAELATPRTEEEVAHTLCQRFPDVSLATARDDVGDALEQLRSLDLVRVAGQDGADTP